MIILSSERCFCITGLCGFLKVWRGGRLLLPDTSHEIALPGETTDIQVEATQRQLNLTTTYSISVVRRIPWQKTALRQVTFVNCARRHT